MKKFIKISSNKTITLITVMILSLAMCVTNIAGFINVIHAEELDEFYDDSDWQDIPEQPQEDPGPSIEEMQRQAEEEQRRAEEEQQRAAEEAARQAAEEEARRIQAEEIAKQAEAARIQQEQEEARRAEQARQAAEEEAARQEVLKRQAQEAEDARKKAEEEAANQEAIRKAQEEEERARQEAEKAKQIQEEVQKTEYSYGLRTMIDGGAISNLTLSNTVGEGDAIVFSVVNVGSMNVDLVYGISGASSDVFAFTLLSGSCDLKQGDMDKFQIAYNPSAPVGTYTCTLFLKDKQDVDNKFTKYINVTANVKGSPSVIRVDVFPQEISLAQGSTNTFQAKVSGSGGEVSQGVTWNVEGARTGGTYISGDGTLTIGGDESASTLTVIATSAQDGRVSGLAKVYVRANSYNVTVRPDPPEGGIVTGGGAVTQGGSVTLSAMPSRNFYFAGWQRDGKIVSTATNYTIYDVRTNIDVIAKFVQNYVTVDASADNYNAGNVVGGGRITYGGSTTLSAIAYDGYVFTGWKEGDSIISTSPSLQLDNVTYNRKFTARFAKTQYNIKLSSVPAEGGSTEGSGTYKLGDKVTIKAKAADGYTFQCWTVNDQTVSRSAEFTIDKLDRDYCINAVFTKNSVAIHTITAGVATTGGTISPSGVINVERNSSVTYTMTPKSGYAILAVAVDGNQVGPVSSYTFKEITSDHTIAVAFLQTDAAIKQAAKSADPQTPPKKVEKLVKEETDVTEPSAEEHVVDLADAANGTAGDEFIQEMDLTDIQIPTDEELGIQPETTVPEKTSPLLEDMGITMAEASDMIKSGNSEPILRAAFYEGTFDAYAENQLAPASDKPDYHTLTREQLEQTSDDDILPYLPNFNAVIMELMDASDMYELAEGGTASVNVSLTRTDSTINEDDKNMLSQAVGQVPLSYFDITLVTRVGSMVKNVKELKTPMKFVIEIPDDIYKEGQTYAVLRVHNGQITILPDLDDNPKTITFMTDRFSSYAISRQQTTAKNLAINFAVGAIITFIIALASLLLLIYHHMLMKRRKLQHIK